MEGKNEIGSGSGDLYMQDVAYYTNNVDTKLNLVHRSPCFLMEIFGPNMAISGAIIVSDSVCVDKFTTLSLLCQPYDYSANIKFTRTLKALKNALHKLEEHYTQLNMYLTPEEIEQLQYPVFRSFKAFDGNIMEFVYTEKVKDNVFCAVDAKNPEIKLIVKFVREYGADAHKLCAEKGFAPILYGVVQVTTCYSMVVMEEVCNAVSLRAYCAAKPNEEEQLKKQCKDVLDLLHGHHLCHGDYRDCNILVSDGGKVAVIDFDWSGKVSECKYPFFYEPQKYTMAKNSLRWQIPSI